MKNAVIVAHIGSDIINILGLEITSQPIFWGESNREHIRISHPAIYNKYASVLDSVISSILKTPDYAGTRNNAIEYVKFMPSGEFLKVAVRASKKGVFFARTIYPIQQEELDRFLTKGTLVKIT